MGLDHRPTQSTKLNVHCTDYKYLAEKQNYDNECRENFKKCVFLPLFYIMLIILEIIYYTS